MYFIAKYTLCVKHCNDMRDNSKRKDKNVMIQITDYTVAKSGLSLGSFEISEKYCKVPSMILLVTYLTALRSK